MTPIMFFIIVAFLGTVAVLMAGGVSMVRGGKFDLAHSNEFMRGRVFMQLMTLALVLIAIFMW